MEVRETYSSNQGIKALSVGSEGLRLAVSHKQASGNSGHSLRIPRSCIILRMLRSDSANSAAGSHTLQTESSLDLRPVSVLRAQRPNG